MPNTGGNLKVFESKETRIKTEKPTNWNALGARNLNLLMSSMPRGKSPLVLILITSYGNT
jgi:hypothetical protein